MIFCHFYHVSPSSALTALPELVIFQKFSELFWLKIPSWDFHGYVAEELGILALDWNWCNSIWKIQPTPKERKN